jgi:solute carrier family 25 (mitochondrial iron transporter), member 28/37
MQVFTASPAAVYTGMGNAISRIQSTEGLRTLWRGVNSVIVGAGPAHAVHFGTYEAVREFLGGNDVGSDAGNVFLATGQSPRPSPIRALISCSCGGCIRNHRQ